MREVLVFVFLLHSVFGQLLSSGSICEGQSTTLSCAHGNLDIVFAVFGRQDTTTCPSGPTSNTTCSGKNALDIVGSLCQGRTSCTISANSYTFGDPCPGIYKYLNVQYFCSYNNVVLSPPICDSQDYTLACGEGTLNIFTATYGRTDNVTCSEGLENISLNNTNCILNAVASVQQRCQGRSSCTVTASDSIFGDPCPGINKYLRIKFECTGRLADTRPIPSPNPVPVPNPVPIPNPVPMPIPNPVPVPIPNPVRPFEPAEKTTCFFKFMKLFCGLKQQIRVDKVFYGRRDQGVCTKFGLGLLGNCDGSHEALAKVRAYCDGQSFCTVFVKDLLLGHTCKDLFLPYLTVTYHCEDAYYHHYYPNAPIYYPPVNGGFPVGFFTPGVNPPVGNSIN